MITIAQIYLDPCPYCGSAIMEQRNFVCLGVDYSSSGSLRHDIEMNSECTDYMEMLALSREQVLTKVTNILVGRLSQ